MTAFPWPCAPVAGRNRSCLSCERCGAFCDELEAVRRPTATRGGWLTSRAAITEAEEMTYELVPSTAQVMPEGHRGPRPVGRAALVAGAWSVSEGRVTQPVPDSDTAGTDERFIAGGTLYGVADPNGFDGLRSMVRNPESPLSGADWEPVVTPRGDAHRRVDDSITLALEEWTYEGDDGGWIVARSPSDLLHAYDMLEGDTCDLVQVAYFAPLDTPLVPTPETGLD